MRKQDYLLAFIKSLSASEKRYFKVFCKTQAEGKKYLNLFNVLEKSEAYDAKDVAQKLQITPVALANDKEYLQEVLLRAMRMFHENSSLENKLQYGFMNANMLYKKRQLKFAESEAKKVLEKSLKNEYFLVAANTTRLLSLVYKDMRMYDKMEAVNQQEIKLLEAATEYSEMIHLLYRFMEPVFTRSTFDGVADAGKHELFKRSEKMLKSNRARLCQSEIKIFYYRHVKPDKQLVLQYSENMYKLLQKEVFLKTVVPTAYFNVQAKLSMLNYELGKHKEAMFYANSMLLATEKNELGIAENVIKTFNHYARSIKMSLLTQTKQFNEAAAFGKQIYKIKDEGSPDEKITFLFDYALALFHTRDYDLCHEQLQQLIDWNTKERTDLQLLARLLFIMLQIQFRNYSLVAYQVKNLRAWKKRANAEIKGVDELLSWLDKLGKSEARHNLRETFSAFKKELQQDVFSELEKELALKKWCEKSR